MRLEKPSKVGKVALQYKTTQFQNSLQKGIHGVKYHAKQYYPQVQINYATPHIVQYVNTYYIHRYRYTYRLYSVILWPRAKGRHLVFLTEDVLHVLPTFSYKPVTRFKKIIRHPQVNLDIKNTNPPCQIQHAGCRSAVYNTFLHTQK